MSSIGTAPPQLYPAPSPHGDLQLTGLRGWVARRPLTGFLVIVLGLSWLLFCIPVLAFHGVIPGANLPVEVFALASTLLIMLPTALWVTSITDGRAGVRALFARVFRWRFGIGWWLVVLFGLPVIALLLGLIFGGSLHTADLGLVLIKQLGSIVLAVVVINLWEETVWAGFFQTRLEARFNFVVAAVLTALPFAGVHVPLLLLDDQVSALSVLIGIAGLLILGIVRSAADGCHAARRLGQRVGSRDLASDLRCQQQQRRPGRFLTGWRRFPCSVVAKQSPAVLDSINQYSPVVIINGLAAILFMIGYVLFGVAMIRTATLPRWSGVLVAVGAPAHLLGFGIAQLVTTAAWPIAISRQCVSRRRARLGRLSARGTHRPLRIVLAADRSTQSMSTASSENSVAKPLALRTACG